MLAEHFERGEAPERALGHYRLAASRCVAGGDLPGAVARIERAHACGAFGQELGELRLLEGEVHIWRSQPDGAARCWREALSIFEEDSLSWWHAYCGLLTAHGLSGDVPAVGRLIIEIANRKLPVSVSAREVSRLSLLVQYFVSVGMRPTAAVLLGRLEPLRDTADPVVAAWVEWARQMFAVYTTGDPWLHREAARAALDNPHLQGEPFPLVLIRIELGLALTNLGLHAEGQAVLRECLAASLPLGAHLVTAVVELCLSRALLGTGDLEEAERLVLHARSAFPEGGLMWGGVQLQLARCRLQAGDLAGASREAKRSRTPAFVSPAFDALSLGIEANARLLGGERDVVASTEESVRLLRDPERRFPAIELFVRFTHAEALHAHGDAAAARIEIQAVKAEILGRAALIPDPELRRAYLERVPENVLILAFAAAIDA